jgi:heat shock protein HslJ
MPEKTSFTLALDKKGRASGQVACNNWSGGYSVAVGQLLLQDLASTRMRCLIDDEATAELEPIYLTRLESGGDYRVEGNSLELRFADGIRWRFTRH